MYIEILIPLKIAFKSLNSVFGSRTLSLVHARALSLSYSISFSLPTHFSTPFSSSLGFSYILNKMEL